jgi:hypothetical protein
VIVGPASALKLADGSLLATLPCEGGGHIQVADEMAGGGRAGGDAEVVRLSAAALAAQGPGARLPGPSPSSSSSSSSAAGRCVLHGELMQLSGEYRVVVVEEEAAAAGVPQQQQRSNSNNGDGNNDNADNTISQRGAVRRHCGGPSLHTGWIDVLRVSALPVGAALVLEAGAALSHPLNARPPNEDDEQQQQQEAAVALARSQS